MQRFKIDESVLILTQFAHLYPSHSGVVIRVRPDPFRTTFNEYTIQFPDGSTADLRKTTAVGVTYHGTADAQLATAGRKQAPQQG